jgi:hypothetical protein
VSSPLAHAESVVWSSTNLPSLEYLYSSVDDYGKVYKGQESAWYDVLQTLMQAMVTVRYNVSVSEVDASGNKIGVLSSGSTVPQGTRVLYEFTPHKYTDISWNGTGSYTDTPYGQWTANAGLPPKGFVICGKTGQNMRNDNFYYESAGRLLYTILGIAPPTKHVDLAGGASCTTQSDGVSQLCTMTEPGAQITTFVFENTIRHFFPSIRHDYYDEGDNNYGGCGVTGTRPMRLPPAPPEEHGAQENDRDIGGLLSGFLYFNPVPSPQEFEASYAPYDVIVPAQTIPFTLVVAGDPDDPLTNPPITPTLTSGGACVVGEPHSINFTSTDPDGDALRYGVDWDADGSVDQWVPPSGYVASGTTQSASRTYAMAGEKTVKVMAQDEGGLSSSWATLSFTCADSATAGLNDGGDDTGDGGGGTFLPPSADLDIRAIPSLVRQGNTTQVNWSATNVQSCTVLGENGDQWSGTESPIGGETSSPITGQTTYTLTCIDTEGNTLQQQATVNVIPGFEEV